MRRRGSTGGKIGLTRAIHAEQASGGLAGVIDVVPAARTVLLRCQPGPGTVAAVAARLPQLPVLTPGAAPEGPVTEVVVAYDGPDLADVARLTGLDEEEVVRQHTAATWSVAFTGFAPGFGYLTGGNPRLQVPRRPEPRTRVPAGSVGLAGEFTGVYPRESPGGWRLIGRTDAVLWDPQRDPPALLTPGARVRFRAAGR